LGGGEAVVCVSSDTSRRVMGLALEKFAICSMEIARRARPVQAACHGCLCESEYVYAVFPTLTRVMGRLKVVEIDTGVKKLQPV